MYRFYGKFRTSDANTTTNEKYSVVEALNGASSLDISYARGLALSRSGHTLTPTGMFTATDTVMNWISVLLTNSILVGNGSIGNSYATLCELPETVIETTEFD